MAEKEERIYVRGYGENNPCDTCEDTSGEECDYCMENYEWNASISRQEAINRMAKVIRTKIFKNEGPTQKIKEQGLEKEYYEYIDFCCTFIAEAALNALLGEK